MTSRVRAREVSVTPERLERWLAGFGARHGDLTVHAGADRVLIDAADGARAECAVPFPPLRIVENRPYAGLLTHVLQDRVVGVVLVRRGGFAAGVFAGREPLATKVGSRYVQGRTAAGGQSQQRFARRREKQTREAYAAAARVVEATVLPHRDDLEAVVVGGDRTGVDRVLAEPRLAPLRALVVPPFLAVPDPKLTVLLRTPDQFRSVRIRLTEPAADERATAEV